MLPPFFRKAVAPASRMVDIICLFPSYVDYTTDFKKQANLSIFPAFFCKDFYFCLKIEVFHFSRPLAVPSILFILSANSVQATAFKNTNFLF